MLALLRTSQTCSTGCHQKWPRRKIEDLIELATVLDAGGGPVVSDNGDGVVVQSQNVGDGEVYGVEFDLSADLAFLGLPDTGVFGNVS